MLLKIADRLEANLELLAVVETWDNGKPIRETLLAVTTFKGFDEAIKIANETIYGLGVSVWSH